MNKKAENLPVTYLYPKPKLTFKKRKNYIARHCNGTESVFFVLNQIFFCFYFFTNTYLLQGPPITVVCQALGVDFLFF